MANSKDSTDLVALAISKGATAQLRTVVDQLADREAARVIYTELMQIARKLEDKYQFGKEKTK